MQNFFYYCILYFFCGTDVIRTRTIHTPNVGGYQLPLYCAILYIIYIFSKNDLSFLISFANVIHLFFIAKHLFNFFPFLSIFYILHKKEENLVSTVWSIFKAFRKYIEFKNERNLLQ